MIDFQPNFVNYDNPKRAQAIWDAYKSDLIVKEKDIGTTSFDEKLNRIVLNCRDSWDLDIKLERFTRIPTESGGCYVTRKTATDDGLYSDIDANGSWANGVMSLEDF